MFCKQCGAEIPDDSTFCNACKNQQENTTITAEEMIPHTENPEEGQSEPITTHKLSLPLRLLINLLIIVLKVILFVVGLAFNILSIITSLLGRLAGGLFAILGTVGLVFWLFDRSMGGVFAVTSCVMIVGGGVIAAAPSLLATIGTAITTFSQSIKFL